MNGKPEWKDAPEWAQWLAMDRDGSWYWFELRPYNATCTWQPGVGRLSTAGDQPPCRDLDWRETLEERPDSDIMIAVRETLLGHAQLERRTWIPDQSQCKPAPGPAECGSKHDSGKPRMDLLDRLALEDVARVLGFGAEKYAAHNWRSGLPTSRLIAAALRHTHAFNDGEDNDPESGLPHLAHAMCCLMFALNMHKTRPDLDDRYRH